ncbi:hypothetical protein BDV35DRAFT_334918 [Aspergillus flavus]|uniref:Uncharacterized protein n=1 Tax=Aspergillus flavus TaxID=5059 RepID=A0A5N6HGI6_ASPFL|nr:hypothetical protein BDV35DRAFT_334918 [Aspergillus flavus]
MMRGLQAEVHSVSTVAVNIASSCTSWWHHRWSICPEGTIVSTSPFAGSMSPSKFSNPWDFNLEQ